ncbi:MAG: phosphoadenosine phosphosulfate reductase family protein, partial [Acetobacter papayae]
MATVFERDDQALELEALRDNPVALLRAAQAQFGEKLAVLSSFGAESALLLAMVAEADPAMRVLFLNTGRHFPETIAYRRDLAAFLGLANVVDIYADP